MEEVWKSIPEFNEYYEVSDRGKVRSLPRLGKIRGGGEVMRGGNILTPRPHNRNNYPIYTLSVHGKNFTRTAHSLVMTAFVGPRPKGLQICHNDGNSENCNLSNLRYDTPKNNTADKMLHGTQLYGENVYNAKLKDDDIIEIRNRRNLGEKLISISKDYNISEVYVYNICIGLKWRHCGGPLTMPTKEIKVLSKGDRELAIQKRKSGETYQAIANFFGVSRNQIFTLTRVKNEN